MNFASLSKYNIKLYLKFYIVNISTQMKKKIIYITIESVKRELDSKTLLALKALKRNYRVVIGQKGNLRQFIKDTNPGIMILKSFGPKNTKHIDFIKKNKFKVVSNDEELITAIDFEDKINWRMDNENISKLDILFAVGETSDFPIIKRKFNSIVKNIVVSGNMRLELLKKKYSILLEKESGKIKQKFGDYILLLTSFAGVNKFYKKSQVDFIYNRIVEDNIDPNSFHITQRNEQVIMQREIFIQTLKFIDEFEKKFPDKKLIISPHPNEKIEFWEYFFNKRKFKNIFLNKDMLSSSYPLINACKLFISFNSTSLLEAYFLRKKSINLLGKKKNISEINLLNKISKVVRSAEEINQAIKDFEKKGISEISIDNLGDIKNFDDNFDSFECVLNNLDNLGEVNSYTKLYKNNFHLLKSKLRSLKNYIKQIISYKFKLNPMIEHLHKTKIGERLKKKAFIENVMHINSYENVNKLKIKKVANEVFLLDS